LPNISTSNIAKNKCYLCDKSPYSLIFYQREQRELKYTQIKSSKTYKKIFETLFSKNSLGSLFTAKQNSVLISGSLVNWDIFKMKDVHDFSIQLDPNFYEKKHEE